MLQIGLGGFLYVAAAPKPGVGEGVAFGPIGMAVAGDGPPSAKMTAVVRMDRSRRMIPSLDPRRDD
jgi:hypothetical protein